MALEALKDASASFHESLTSQHNLLPLDLLVR